MGYSADKSPLIGHLAVPIRRLKPLGAQRQEKCGPNHLTREGLHATTPQWKKASGYPRQSRVENAFFRYKSIIEDGLRARSPAGQGSEVVLGCEILNRMTALGRPVSYRIGR